MSTINIGDTIRVLKGDHRGKQGVIVEMPEEVDGDYVITVTKPPCFKGNTLTIGDDVFVAYSDGPILAIQASDRLKVCLNALHFGMLNSRLIDYGTALSADVLCVNSLVVRVAFDIETIMSTDEEAATHIVTQVRRELGKYSD